jgi:hypothetical protein
MISLRHSKIHSNRAARRPRRRLARQGPLSGAPLRRPLPRAAARGGAPDRQLAPPGVRARHGVALRPQGAGAAASLVGRNRTATKHQNLLCWGRGARSSFPASGASHHISPAVVPPHPSLLLHRSLSNYLPSPLPLPQVHFNLHVIQDSSRKMGDFRARGVSFDVEAYKAQVRRLVTLQWGRQTLDLPLALEQSCTDL